MRTCHVVYAFGSDSMVGTEMFLSNSAVRYSEFGVHVHVLSFSW